MMKMLMNIANYYAVRVDKSKVNDDDDDDSDDDDDDEHSHLPRRQSGQVQKKNTKTMDVLN